MTQPTWQQLASESVQSQAEDVVDLPLNITLLDSSGVIRFSGAEASSFLQNQLTNDAALITPEQAQLSGYCSAKGRLLGLFLVVACGPDYLLITPRQMIPGLIKRLQMFVMRSAVTIEDISEQWGVVGVWGAEAGTFIQTGGMMPLNEYLAASAASKYSDVLTVSAGWSQPGYRLIGPRESLAQWLSTETAALTRENNWNLQTINAGQPELANATAEAFVPQMVNLDLIDGLSFQKGCYPGQEIVARTRYLGKLKRRMFLFEAQNCSAEPGDPIHALGNDQSVGTVVNVAQSSNNGVRLLAVLRIEALQKNLSLGQGQVLTRLDLPYPVVDNPATA